MIFTQMQTKVDNILNAIHALPFNQELAQGHLNQDTFMFYLQQDALYLIDFAKALAITAAKLPDTEFTQTFLQFSLDAVNAERMLHLNYLQRFNIDTTNIEPSPACFMYTHFLLKVAQMDAVEQSLSAVLPCFWVYREVGKNIAQLNANSTKKNPYQDWIDLYSSEAFDQSVNTAITITNQMAKSASPALQKKMLSAFEYSTKLEWLFWHSAYQQEQWLI